MVYADKCKLNQILSNLIDNAIKFASAGSITITVQKNYNNNNKKEECVIDVRYTGVGIHKEIFPRLFSKFAAMSKDGTRLGLYLQKKLLMLMMARCGQRTMRMKKGATFSFSLPFNN